MVRGRILTIGALAGVVTLIPGLGIGLNAAGAQTATPGTPAGFVGTASPTVKGCDPIGTVACLLPFPDDYYTEPDKATVTGRRVHITLAMTPADVHGKHVNPAEWNRNDGFSPGSPILTVVPGINLARTGAAPQTNIGISLRRAAPVVLLDAATGARVPYWVELDSNATSSARQAFIVRPAIRLADGTRYIVALRNLRDGSGALIPPPPGFAAMLGKKPPADHVLRARWFSLRPVFKALRHDGVGMAGLYQAWDFTTSSTLSLTGRVLHMRDQAFAGLHGKSPKVVVTSVVSPTPKQNANIARIVSGYVEVPSYLNAPGGPPGSRFHYASANPGPYDTPTQIPGNVQHALFECVVPRAALISPGQAVIFGHGLFGDQTNVEAGNVEATAQTNDVTVCGAVWLGLASPDLLSDAAIIENLSKFPAIPDQMQQAYLDFLFLDRAIASPDGLAKLAAFHGPHGRPLLATSHRLLGYVGYSEGGIEGTALAALAQDYTRALLGVPGMDYALLLNRSIDFSPFEKLLSGVYPDKLEQQIGFGLLQMLWDRGDSDGYAAHVTSNPLPNTPVKQVLLHEAFGDHQVSNVSTEMLARTLGLHVHQPAIASGRSLDKVPFWGIPAIPSYPFSGSALVLWDSGSPPDPPANIPPTNGHDPHTDPGNTPAALEQGILFLLTGQVYDTCGGLPCVGVRT